MFFSSRRHCDSGVRRGYAMQCPLDEIPKTVSRPVPSRLLRQFWVLSIAATAVITITLLGIQFANRPGIQPAHSGGTETDRPANSQTPATHRHGVTILPGKDPYLATGQVDEKGQPTRIACATCHATKPANAAAKLGTPLVNFHQDLIGHHGQLSCTSCHNSSDGYASLRLADGRTVPYVESMNLCAQCHGPQFRDYQHGAHGGMTGFWDLARGGRTRNTCTTCHNSHSPKYPTVIPAPRPNDRFSPREKHD